MLVLSRKQGESIEIGDRRVLVRVLGIKRSKVQLGIDAPHDVAIHRSEKADQHFSASTDEDREGVGIKAGGDTATPAVQNCGNSGNRIKAVQSSAAERNRVGPIGAVLGENVLDDLVRAQAEIAALAELVSSKDRGAARQVAAAVVERLTVIEKSVRLARRQRSAQPIAAFIDSQSVATQKPGDRDEVADQPSQSEVWGETCEEESTLLRESTPNFNVSTARCSIA